MDKSLFDKIKIGDKAPEIFNMVVEIPKGSQNKYEYNEKIHAFTLDRVLRSPLHYPADYGFIPETRADDEDHLDVLALGESTFPGCIVKVRPIGLLEMIDDGVHDYKILAAQVNNVRFDNIKNLDDMKEINPHFLKEVSHFFKAYKHLEGKEVKIKDWKNREEAINEINKTIKRYKLIG
jgi:inorganic pyrophosphatase